jgi:YHS domain-containing protein
MKFAVLILSILFFASCSTKFTLQKRKYNNKGYYFASSSNKHLPDKKEVKQSKQLAEKKSTAIPQSIAGTNQAVNETKTLKTRTENNALHLASDKQKNKVFASVSKKSYSFAQIRELQEMKDNFKRKNFRNSAGTKPLQMFSGEMGIWGIIGILSAVVSLIALFYYLIIMFAVFSVIFNSPTTAIITFVIILLVIAAIGIVIILNSD